MDRNQVIGFALLVALVIAYFTYNQHEQKVFLEQKHADSVAYAKAHPRPVVDSSKAITATTPAAAAATAASDSLAQAQLNALPPAYHGQAQTITLENKKLAIQFTTKGAFPVAANVKAYKTYNQKPLYIFNGKGNELSAILPVDNGRSTADLYFTPVTKNEPNGDRSVDFTADLGNGKRVDITYTLPADDYMMRCSIALTGMPAAVLPLSVQTIGISTEKDISRERTGFTGNQVYYHNKNGDEDYFTLRNEEKKVTDDGSALWVGFRKEYFSTALVADDNFTKTTLKFITRTDSNNIAQYNATMDLPLKQAGSTALGSMRWYMGPNDYRTLKSYNIGLDEMVPLGTGVTAFVKYINRWLIVPLFYLLASFVNSYVLIIVIMTLFIRLILSFFTYKSYLSSAKMRVLKPELDELRAKCGDDQQKFSMEQMKLYRTAGVNPLGGCLPMLFQMPILLAMYYMFPSFIEFRQQHFLWCNDLSNYDSIVSFGFNIPWYGDHVSLFTLLMTASSLFLALYNRNMTPQDPNNPMLKYMPYVFPIFLMGMFNRMAAALTFYYTFSNLLSIAQQFIIQKYFINEKAIHAQLQANKNKPATPSKWQQKLEEMQKVQQDRNKIQPRRK